MKRIVQKLHNKRNFIKFIKTNTEGVKSTFGKYTSTLSPGIHFYIPLLQQIKWVNLKTFKLTSSIRTKTKDNSFVTIINESIHKVENSADYFYKSTNPESFLTSFIEKIVIEKCSRMSLTEIYENTFDIESSINNQVPQLMKQYGIFVEKSLVVDIKPDEDTIKSMNSVLIAKRKNEAQIHESEAFRFKLVKEAEANAERMKLQGIGLAEMRKALSDGYNETISRISNDLKISPLESMNFIMKMMELDARKELATSNNAKVIFWEENNKDKLDTFRREILNEDYINKI